MEFFAILALLAALGAGQQSASVAPIPGGEVVKCQVREIDAEQFRLQGGLFGYISRHTNNELLAGTWAAVAARDWNTPTSDVLVTKFESTIGKPLEQATEADVKKLVDEFGWMIAIPKVQALGALTLYTERAWPPAVSAGMLEALGMPATAGDRGVVARYSLIGDQGGKVRVMGCTVPRDAEVQPNHIARVAGPGDEVPGWVQRLLKTDPKAAQIDFAENSKKMAKLLSDETAIK